jgi:ribosome biogenesis GTPase
VERVEPRHGTLVRQIQGRKQVLAANVDQAVIVASCADPPLKPGLIDRFLITAESSGITPIICLNKSDLADPAERESVRSVYAGLGYTVLVTNAVTGEGCADLAARLAGRASVVAGQSGVGKSSLLNAVQPGLGLKTGQVSDVHRKGKHTTTRATLIPLACSGWVVDTPGIRQFELCAVPPQESGRWFVEFQNLSHQCRFADCTHVHETDCAVKAAIERGEISRMRYDSYRRILLGEPL